METVTQGQPHGADPSTLEALVLYDDARSARRALKLFDRLTRDSHGYLHFPLELCRFDELRTPARADDARREAREAELLVISCRSGATLPATVAAWLEAWADTAAGENHAVVVLTSREPENREASSPAAEGLRECARRHGLAWLDRPDIRTELAKHSLARASQRRTGTISPAPACPATTVRSRTSACATAAH